MYDESADTILHGTGRETFDAVKMLKAPIPRCTNPLLGQTIRGAASVTASGNWLS